MDTQGASPQSPNSVISQQEIMDFPISESSASPATPVDLVVSEPDWKVLSSKLDTPTHINLQVFGFFSESENSVNESDKELSSTASTAWVDFKDETEAKLGIKPYCPRHKVNTHTEVQCTADVMSLANKRQKL